MSKEVKVRGCSPLTLVNGQYWCERIGKSVYVADKKPLCPSDCAVRISRRSDKKAPKE